jgi:hypothetical protein
MPFASIPVELKIRVLGFLIGVAHVIAGIAAWQEPNSLNVTQLAAFHSFTTWLGFGPVGAGFILFIAGIMAIVASGGGLPPWARGVLFLPQQFLMILVVVAIYGVFVTGVYPDGYIPVGGGWFILSDQFLVWACALSHTVWLSALVLGGLTSARAGGA